ncbi:macrolide ABC transporter ATP-binding protein [bacterium CG2_30_37_16]|nr:MAG: macrolide ABC transporter ATP-binding protein [bacterium CG2_30_37_16]PIP30449.1 MAG: macrolide ABC transporter ATP-binding protein [bacterium (Candidatus Howlettbacteria) CG23_combo_of_CG06-09_8_20_14_all_37_9]PJB05808.1 MAG: macrolide ABC transporter ATP-binding protein [bacterium (Candidatus Howlettbacteria) CG_4_9_14_3_um_filter_37_10]
MIKLENISKSFLLDTYENKVLKNIDIEIFEGEFISIIGPSGSGKSTLMNIIGCLDRPTMGTYLLDGIDVLSKKDKDLANIRSKKIGFVFQSFNLIPRLSLLANVETPMIYARSKNRKKKATEILNKVGLNHRLNYKPNQVSGGETQRAAIARALINDPKIILADEPTGNLDSKNGAEVLKIFKELNEKGVTIILVTHDPNIAKMAQRTIRLMDGEVEKDV